MDSLRILHNKVFFIASSFYIYSTRKSQVIGNATMCKLHKVSRGLYYYVPLIPTTPHTAAGIRIDPPPSEPKATGHRPEKTGLSKIHICCFHLCLSKHPTPTMSECQMKDSTTHPILSMLLTHTTSGPPVDKTVITTWEV